MSLEQRNHDRAIAKGHQVEKGDEQSQLPETHVPTPFPSIASLSLLSSTSFKINAPRTPPARSSSAGLSRRKRARTNATAAITNSREGWNTSLPSLSAATTMS